MRLDKDEIVMGANVGIPIGIALGLILMIVLGVFTATPHTATPQEIIIKSVRITGEYNVTGIISGYEVSQLNKTFVQVEFFGVFSLTLDNNHTLLLNTDRGLFRNEGAVEVTGYQLIFHVPALEGYYFEPVTFGS